MVSTGVINILCGIWGLLVVASIIVFIMIKLKPEKDLKELAQRTQSWWVMIGIFTVAIITHRIFGILFLCFISFLAVKEYFTMIPTRRVDRNVLFWVYLSIPVQYFWAYIEWYGMFIVFIPVYMFLIIPTRMIFAKQTEGFLRSAGTIQWGLMIAIFSISHTAYLLILPVIEETASGGIGLLLYLVFLTQFNDVAQYVWGKSFGKHKIIEAISPKKTWEGFLGGVVSTTALSIIIHSFLTPFSWSHAIIAGMIISIAGFMGDITISALKRDLGIKDTGQSIPGHGGVLDRIDSLTFSAPLFFHFTYYLYY